MKSSLLALLLISILSTPEKSENFQYSTVVIATSIKITGNSNINSFSCDLERFNQLDTLNIKYQRNGRSFRFDSVFLQFDIAQFNCGNKLINRDFHKLLNQKEYPFLTIHLRELLIDSTNQSNQLTPEDINCGTAEVSINLSGKTNDYLLNFDHNEQQIKASFSLNIEDYDLTPPTGFLV